MIPSLEVKFIGENEIRSCLWKLHELVNSISIPSNNKNNNASGISISPSIFLSTTPPILPHNKNNNNNNSNSNSNNNSPPKTRPRGSTSSSAVVHSLSQSVDENSSHSSTLSSSSSPPSNSSPSSSFIAGGSSGNGNGTPNANGEEGYVYADSGTRSWKKAAVAASLDAMKELGIHTYSRS